MPGWVVTACGVEPSPRDLWPLEEELLAPNNGSAVVWCGSGSSALYMSYLALSSREPDAAKPELIVPAISCHAPAAVADMAGLSVRTADVDAVYGMPTLTSIAARASARTKAVLFVHLYGHAMNLAEIQRWCATNGYCLIEDCAQALGARYEDGTAVGAYGDFVVHSFSPTKILECGGGALVVKNEADGSVLLERLWKEPVWSELQASARAEMELGFRSLFYTLVARKRTRREADISAEYMARLPEYYPLFLRPFPSASRLAREWSSLADGLAQRLARAELYCSLLEQGPWSLLQGWRKSGVCWRFSLLLDEAEKVVGFSEALRRQSIHVSNHYWNLADFFRPDDQCPNADSFGRSAVNFWVDSIASRGYIRRCCAASLYLARKTASASTTGGR